jgi:serine protease Do
VIDEMGIILTNGHVIDQSTEIHFLFSHQRQEILLMAEIIARDYDLDLALLRVEFGEHQVPVLLLGDSEKVEVGEYVISIGNPFGQGHTLTQGIVSAIGRQGFGPFSTYLQTDARINPGSSGGPLLNLTGEVIGVNHAIDERAEGIGFAIPINAVKEVLFELKQTGTVRRSDLGVKFDRLSADVGRSIKANSYIGYPVVTQVSEKGPALQAGIRDYDVLVEWNGVRLGGANILSQLLENTHPGTLIKLKVFRDSQLLELDLRLGLHQQPLDNR